MKVLSIRNVQTTGHWYDLAGREVPPTHLLTEELIKFYPNEPVTVVVPSGYGEVQCLRSLFMRADRLHEDTFTCNYLTLSGSNVSRVRLALPRLAEYIGIYGYRYTTFASTSFGDGNDLTTVSVKSTVDSYPVLIAVRIGNEIFVKIPHSLSFTRGAIIALMGEDEWLVGHYTCPMTSLVHQPTADETEDDPNDEEDNELLYPCERCGEDEQGDGREYTYITERGNEEQICPSCRSALRRADYSVYECDDCHCLVHRTEAVTDDSDTVLCQRCFEDHDYSRCDGCDNIVRDVWYHDGTDRYLCESCYDLARANESSLRGYHERPKYIWHSTAGDPASGLLFLGSECEWSTRRQQEDLAEFLRLNMPGCGDEYRFFMMEDSSLRDGVELVSMPHTLNAWLELRPHLAGVVEEVANSYHHKGKSDGMHIHISRKGMSEMHERRFIALFDLCQKEWETLARRTDKYDSYYMYMSNDYFDLDIDMSDWYNVMENIKDLMDRSRYRCVNATNSHTLEVRIFQTPTTTQQWFAAIEATHAAYQFTKNLSFDRLYWLYQHGLLWSAFVRYSSTDPRYTDLRDELKNVPLVAETANIELEQAI